MDARIRELVSLGASVSAHCFPCLDYHLEKVRTMGIGEEDIQESVRAGLMVMDGEGRKMWERIQALFPEICPKKTEIPPKGRPMISNGQASVVRF